MRDPEAPVPDEQPEAVEVVQADVVEATPADEAHRLGIELPDDPDDALRLVLGEVSEARAEADRYLDDLRRLAADFDNYRKRMRREQSQHVERASERVIGRLMPALDSFDAALALEPDTPVEQKLVEGMRRTYQQVMDVLTEEGVQIVATAGEPFDPRVHEAVSTADAGDGPLMVTRELRRGYLLRGRVVRPAMVEVRTADPE